MTPEANLRLQIEKETIKNVQWLGEMQRKTERNEVKLSTVNLLI